MTHNKNKNNNENETGARHRSIAHRLTASEQVWLNNNIKSLQDLLDLHSAVQKGGQYGRYRYYELEERGDRDDSGSINNVAGPRMICVSCGNDVLDITEDESRIVRWVDDVMTIVAYLKSPAGMQPYPYASFERVLIYDRRTFSKRRRKNSRSLPKPDALNTRQSKGAHAGRL